MHKTVVADVLSREMRREIGQFFTPAHVASFMSNMFSISFKNIRLLDAGSGNGALSQALIRRICSLRKKPNSVEITAYELDPLLIPSLTETMKTCQLSCERSGLSFSFKIYNEDFISAAVGCLSSGLYSSNSCLYNMAIVNPPYRKIQSDSRVRLLLRSVGIETSNLYSAFISLIIKMLSSDGELVAITPRSFCNGPYFQLFRKELLSHMSLEKLHIFDSRKAAFKQDAVLQENVIIHAKKNTNQSKFVTLSKSNGEACAEVIGRQVSYDDVILKSDPQKFIHFVIEDSHFKVRSLMADLPETLNGLGVSVSTGRVVDFRARKFLQQMPGTFTIPLIYPCHLDNGSVAWPKKKSRKPNAIIGAAETRALFVATGYYVLVKRFSAKEEHKRIVAALFRPEDVHCDWVAFENHLNYIHANGSGLALDLATGLTAFLNSSIVDAYFRLFNGHTQVNANDLRSLRYPSRGCLRKLGGHISSAQMRDQDAIDDVVNSHIFREKNNDL